MIQIVKRITLAVLLATFVAGPVALDKNIVFAAEQASGPEQQNQPTEVQQNEGNNHAGHHS